jgi:hypothetical protein
MLRRWETFDLTDEQLHDAFEFFFLGVFTEQARELDVTIPLLRFDCEVGVSIQLDATQFAVERFTPEQQEALWNLASFPDTMELADFRSFSRARFSLVGGEVRDPAGPEFASDVVAAATDFITALRLNQAGDVAASGVFSKERGAFEFRSSVAAVQDRFGVRRRESDPYVLGAEGIYGMRRRFRSLRDLAPQQRSDLGVALR